jgi:trimeric autotransporter adhesin
MSHAQGRVAPTTLRRFGKVDCDVLDFKRARRRDASTLVRLGEFVETSYCVTTLRRALRKNALRANQDVSRGASGDDKTVHGSGSGGASSGSSSLGSGNSSSYSSGNASPNTDDANVRVIAPPPRRFTRAINVLDDALAERNNRNRINRNVGHDYGGIIKKSTFASLTESALLNLRKLDAKMDARRDAKLKQGTEVTTKSEPAESDPTATPEGKASSESSDKLKADSDSPKQHVRFLFDDSEKPGAGDAVAVQTNENDISTINSSHSVSVNAGNGKNPLQTNLVATEGKHAGLVVTSTGEEMILDPKTAKRWNDAMTCEDFREKKALSFKARLSWKYGPEFVEILDERIEEEKQKRLKGNKGSLLLEQGVGVDGTGGKWVAEEAKVGGESSSSSSSISATNSNTNSGSKNSFDNPSHATHELKDKADLLEEEFDRHLASLEQQESSSGGAKDALESEPSPESESTRRIETMNEESKSLNFATASGMKGGSTSSMEGAGESVGNSSSVKSSSSSSNTTTTTQATTEAATRTSVESGSKPESEPVSSSKPEPKPDEDLTFNKIMLPNDLAPGMNLVVILTRLKHIESVDSWMGVRQALEHLLKQQTKDVQLPGGELNM